MQAADITGTCWLVPHWQTLEEARRVAEDHIATHFRAALDAHLDAASGNAGKPLPPLALRLSPGVGKSHIALEQLAQFGQAFLTHGHVIFYCPTLELAEEAAEKLRAMAPALPIAVLRGRGAINPATGQPMCRKHQLAREISGFVPSIRAALCHGKDASGREVAAPCAAGCPWLGQIGRLNAEPHVIFAAHAYLQSGLPVRGKRALTIIDERFWQAMTGTKRITVEDWLTVMPAAISRKLQERCMLLRQVALQALDAGQPVIDAILAAGLTGTDLDRMIEAERLAIASPVITPDMTPAEAETAWQRFDRKVVLAARARLAILGLLIERLPHAGTERLTLERGAGGRVIVLHKCRTLPEDTPCLLLDADADEAILSAVAPGTRVLRVDVRPQADITQITDLTCSGSWLLTEGNREAGLGRALRIIEREAARGRVLLVSTRPVLARLAGSGEDTLPERIEIAGAEARWFGPRMLGVNRYADFDTVIILGRQQPPVGAIEAEMRCLFGDGAEPLAFLPDARLQAGCRSRLHTNGHLAEAPAQIHPDPRGMAVLLQLREYMTLQAIARLRLMRPDRLKRVIVLSNLPLPELPVDHLSPLAIIAADTPPCPYHRQRARLAGALDATSHPPVLGLRLSATGLAEDLPQAFPTLASAKEFRRGLDTATLQGLVEDLARERGWPCIFVELRSPAGRKPIPAALFTDITTVPATASRLWPGLTCA